jgi:hypothetical protein
MTRCIACGQPDEPNLHDNAHCPAMRKAVANPFPVPDDELTEAQIAFLKTVSLVDELCTTLERARPFVAWFKNGNEVDVLEKIDELIAKVRGSA